MKIQNTGGKAIAIGSLSLLPGETKTLPEEFVENPVIEFLAYKKFIALEGEPEKALPESKQASECSDSGKNSGEPEQLSEEPKQRLFSMKKSELETLAKEKGLSVKKDDTTASLREKLLSLDKEKENDKPELPEESEEPGKEAEPEIPEQPGEQV